MSAFYVVSLLSRVRFLVNAYCLVLDVTLEYIRVQYIQGPYQSRLGTADHALNRVAHVATVA
jgi:hypothetical protein